MLTTPLHDWRLRNFNIRKHYMIRAIIKKLSRRRILTSPYDFFFERIWWGISWLRYFFRHSLRLPKTVERILVIRVSGIGDVIRTTPVIEKLREKYSNAEIIYLTSRAASPVLEFNPHINQLFTEDDEIKIKRLSYEWVVNLQLYDNSEFVKEIMSKINYRRVSGNYFDKNGRYRRGGNFQYYFSTLIEDFARGAIGLPYSWEDSEKVRIYIPESRKRIYKAIESKYGIGNGKYIGLNLGSHSKEAFWYRDYSLGFLRKLVENLYDRYNLILLGQEGNLGEDERFKLAEMRSDYPKIVNLIDALTLEELILVLKRCSAFVSSDSGAVHISMAVGTPVIILFGAESGKRIISPKRRGRTYSIVNSNLECSPCKRWRMKEECIANKRAQCMETLPIAKILNEIDYFLKLSWGDQ